MIRRFGEPLVRGQKYRLRHGVYAVLRLEREVLGPVTFVPLLQGLA